MLVNYLEPNELCNELLLDYPFRNTIATFQSFFNSKKEKLTLKRIDVMWCK